MLNKKLIIALLAIVILFLGIFSFAQSGENEETPETVDENTDKGNDTTKPVVSDKADDEKPANVIKTNEQNNAVVETAKKEVTITFNSNGGSSVIAQKIIQGKAINKPNNPTWVGHKFLGWYVDNGIWNFTWAVNDNLTLIAKWEVVEDKPVVTPEDVYTMSVGSIGADAFAPEGRALILKNNTDITSSVTTLKSGDTILGSYVASIQGIRINKAQFSNYSSFQVVLNDGTTHQVK